MTSTPEFALLRRPLAALISFLLIVQPIAANAQVVAASGAGRPTVETAQNGVPLVQIVAPNGAGVSHNVYQGYSVDARGVVLNNSPVIVATRQAGYIAGNPNLAGGSARIILNEVTGTSPSDLRGYTEVAGARADVVVANPNGITCNGCGFINTGRGILTTGTPVFGGSGSLDAFRVTGGTIAIGANGMEGRYADQIDLIARGVSVAGTLNANTLNVVAGANQVAYANLAATPIAGAGGAPAAAIDVAALGGMYANKIHLIATEAGVGVNSQGALAAQNGDFQLDAAGRVTLGGTVGAGGRLDIAAQDIDNGGTFYGAGEVNISASALTNTGRVFGRDITVHATDLTNQDTGIVAAGHALRLYVTDTLANLDGGLLASAGTLAIAGDAARDANGWLATRTTHVVNRSADIQADGDIEITAATVDNTRTRLVTGTRILDSDITLAQELDGAWSGSVVGRIYRNTGGAEHWHIAESASVPTFTIQNRDMGGRRYAIVTESREDYLVSATTESRILAGGNLYLRADTVNNTASRIEAAGSLAADVGTLNNTGYALNSTTRDTIWTGWCSDIQGDSPGRLGGCRSGWIWTASVADTITGTNATLPATVVGSQTLALNAETVVNSALDAQGLPPGGFNPADGSPGYAPPAFVFTTPTGALYTVNPDGSSRYVVETDPRFTQYANFIGSDYLLGLLGLDPMATGTRLGDAYYEQQLVRDQLLRLRGRTDYRAGGTLNAEYQALLESGAEFVREFQLAPGVTLSQEQVAALARDIVWLETRQVAGQDVLVPVVYLGASYTPRSTSALLGGGRTTRITATDILNQSGTIAGSEELSLVARHDIVSESGLLQGGAVTLSAGNDIRLATATQAVEFDPGQTFTHEGAASRIEARQLTMVAGQDLSLQGASVQADNAMLQAGRDLAIGSQAIATEQHLANGGSTFDRSAVAQRGSTLDIAGDLTLLAGQDVTVAGSDVRAGNHLTAAAGRNLNLVTARETDSEAYSAHSSTVDHVWQKNSDSGRRSSLTAGSDVTLLAGDTFIAEGATIGAGGDASLAADTIIVAAAHDTYSETGSYSNKGKRGSQQSQTQIQTIDAIGSIVEAGGNLNIQSAGDTIVEGSALAAGEQGTLATGGDLQLLAAQSSRYVDLYRASQGAKEATELKYHEERVNQLLTTITVGSGLDIQVGGNFSAATAERNEDGSFRADRMTTAGVVRGDSRQQVSVARTGDDADPQARSSQVLGDLESQGIRNGASDSFTPAATQSGAEALQTYLQSGLVQVRNDPALSARLGTILRNTEGAALTYRDDSGRVSLTVAGQAKVQEVFNTLKLTETFDQKHFADQQTAMIVTLIVAIVLTVCTAGAAGAAIAGALGASTTGTVALMINAAVIGMSSTMVGQLAAGASFDDAFQAGVRAGLVSAASAGIAAGAAEAVNGLNATPAVSGTAGTTTGTATATVETASTIQSGTQAVQVGSNGAQNLTTLQRLGTAAYWEQTALNATGQGLLAEAQGGSFEDGFTGSVIGGLGATGATVIGDNTTGNPFGNIAGHAVLGCAVASASRQDCASGALGGAASASLARVIDGVLPAQETLDANGNVVSEGMSKRTRDAIIAGTTVAGSAALASATGQDMMTAANAAANEVTNNYLDHRKPNAARMSETEQYEAAVAACSAGNADACGRRDQLATLSAQRDANLRQACGGATPDLCNQLAREAAAMGNRVNGQHGGFVYANSPEQGSIRNLNTETIGPPSENLAYTDSFQYQAGRSTSSALPAGGAAATVLAAPETLVGAVVSNAAIGATISGTTQYADTGNVDPTELAIDTGVSAVAGGATYGVVRATSTGIDVIDAALTSKASTTSTVNEMAAVEKAGVANGESSLPIYNPQGAARAEANGGNWSGGSLSETVRNIAGPDPQITYTASGKTVYTNPTTGASVVYDNAGNYYRVQNAAGQYLDQGGNLIPNNVPLIGSDRTTQTGVPSEVRRGLTHFHNTDPPN